jgi:ParB family chromosome partitioning protein
VARSDESGLLDAPTDLIDPNPENPRLVFRESEMNALLESIKEVGIRVPLSLYREGKRFVLIDGERRWRSAKRLNLKTVPALLQPKPGPLENLLTMFNIHNVRVEWDLMPMALKLDRVRDLLAAEGRASSPKDIAGATGVPLPTVRRAFELLELPDRYQKMLMEEANKPRDQQKIKADLFVEINKSMRAVERYVPEVFDQVTEAEYRDRLVEKYVAGTVNNVVRFRDLARIARAERAGGDPAEAAPIVVRVITDPKYTIERAYSDSVEPAYTSRDIETRAGALADRLEGLAADQVTPSARKALMRLSRALKSLLG